jgi:hypothetical protein
VRCRDPAFQWCVRNCAGGDGCVMLPPALSGHAAVECTAACPGQFDHPVPAGVRLLRWSCADDCGCAGHVCSNSLVLVRRFAARLACCMSMMPNVAGNHSKHLLE